MRNTLVFWFTGLSGAGKTTIVNEACRLLLKHNKKFKVYDGDIVRENINKHLTFSPEHIKQNNKIIAKLCKKDIRSKRYNYIFVAVISPFQEVRDEVRKIIGNTFNLIYCKISIKEVINRDTKSLYKKALAGEIENFIGIDKKNPYQIPGNADLVLDTAKKDIKTCVDKFVNFINFKDKK